MASLCYDMTSLWMTVPTLLSSQHRAGHLRRSNGKAGAVGAAARLCFVCPAVVYSVCKLRHAASTLGSSLLLQAACFQCNSLAS